MPVTCAWHPTPDSLDLLETAVEPPTSLAWTGMHYVTPLPHPRHAGWQAIRERIFKAMISAQVPPKRLERFAECASHRYILVKYSDQDCPTYKAATATCHDRLCTPCANQRANTIRRNLAEHLPRWEWLFLTLTVRSTVDPLRDQIARLHRYFRKLRQTPIWKDNVQGGFATIEITLNPDTNLWHPHLHCILASRWLPVRPTREAWEKITGGSRVIDLQKVKDTKEIARYVTKYVTKPVAAPVTRRFDMCVEAIEALRGQRLLITFGIAAKWHLTRDQSEEGWEFYGSDRDLQLGVALGNPWWIILAKALEAADPATGIMPVHLFLPP